MKPSGLLAVILSASIPTSAFAQTFSASQAGTAAQASVSGTAGTVQIVPATFGALAPLSLPAPSLAPGLTLSPGLTPTAIAAAIQSAPSAAQVSGAIPVLPAALAAAPSPAAAATEPYGEGVSLQNAVGKGPMFVAPSAAVRAGPEATSRSRSAGGPLIPAINKMRRAGVISHSTMMHFYQLSSLTMQFGLLASFGYQYGYFLLTTGTLVLSWGSYAIFSLFFQDPPSETVDAAMATRLENLAKLAHAR